MKYIIDLLREFNIVPSSLEHFDLALTHPSCNSQNNTKHHDYERLEFIGDSVIGFVTADLIYKHYPDMNQGTMTKLRSSLVCSKGLATFAREISLQEFIKTGPSINANQIFSSDKILEDVFEALCGAIYLTCGIDIAFKFIRDLFEEKVINFNLDDLVDPKTKLQEEIQAEYRDAVQYILVNEEGPAHDRTFYVQVKYNGIVLGSGNGKSKKQAEEAAAKDALNKRSI